MDVNKDLDYMFTVTGKLLWVFGIWPDPRIPMDDFRRPSIRLVFIMSVISLCISTPQLVNVALAWGNLALMVRLFVSVNFSLLAVFKLGITWYHGKILHTVLVSIMTDWMTSTSDWERNTMLKMTRFGRSLSLRGWMAVIGLSIVSYTIHVSKFVKTLHMPHRTLLYRIERIQKSPFYEILYFVQLIGGTSSVFANYVVDSFVAILVLHICSQLMNLRTTLSNLVKELADKSISSSKFKKGLTAIVERHEHLIRNANTIDNCYSSILFVNMILVTLQMCFICFQIFTMITDNVQISVFSMAFLTFYIALVLTNTYACCSSADRLIIESTKMRYGVFECQWYNISPTAAKDLMFIVYRSTIPLKLTAGKFGIFSLEMFGRTLQTSVGYLSALLTLRN